MVGSFVCSPQGNLRAAEFPPLFDELALHQAAALFADETGAVRRFVGANGELDLRFARGRAVVKPFASGTLFVLGTYGLDLQLLSLSLEQAARRLEQPAVAVEEPPRGSPVALPAELAGTRDGLLQALLRQIGPVAEPVLDETWAAWAASGPHDRIGWQTLVDALAREIDDQEGRARFLSEVRDLLA